MVEVMRCVGDSVCDFLSDPIMVEDALSAHR